LINNVKAGKINLDSLEFDLNTGKVLSKDQEFIMFFEMRFKTSLKKVMNKMDKLVKEKKVSETVAWNEHCLTDLVDASTFFCEYYMLRRLYGSLHGE